MIERIAMESRPATNFSRLIHTREFTLGQASDLDVSVFTLFLFFGRVHRGFKAADAITQSFSEFR